MEEHRDSPPRRIVLHAGDGGDRQSPTRPIPIRTRSLSYSAPVFRASYSDVPRSPAADYLAEFAFRDDAFDGPGFEEGKRVRNYLIGQKIGEGGFSECWEAYVLEQQRTFVQLPEKVALKIVADPRCIKDFRREIHVWELLDHPNVLPLLDYFAGEGYQVAVTILAENGSLQDLVARTGGLDEDEARRIFRNVCCAVQYLHEIMRIAHMDIKLENVMIGRDGSVYLGDFGMCVCENLLRASSCGADDHDIFCKGSITSLPPEALLIEPTQTESTSEKESFELKCKQDIWALGVLLYALAVGKLPFYDDYIPRLQQTIIAGSYLALPESLSQELRLLVGRLLSVDPGERPCISTVLTDAWLDRK